MDSKAALVAAWHDNMPAFLDQYTGSHLEEPEISFLKRVLVVNPAVRPTAEQLLQDPYLALG